jgi:hypothetical protein
MAPGLRTFRSIRLIAAALFVASLLFAISPRPAPAAALIERLSSSGSVTGGRVITIKFELRAPAYAGGALIWVTSNSALIPVPSNVIVPPGEDELILKVTTRATLTTTAVTISARNGGLTLTTVTTVKEPYLSSLSLQTVIRAGGEGKLTVRLSGIAPSGGIVVALAASPSAYLTLPSSVTISAGAAGKTLIFPAAMVEDEEAVTVTASYDGRSVSKPTVVRRMST